MLYNEFIENTNCKDTEYNYKVYKSLEVLYMDNDKLTKEDIYKVGKKLVDNSLTEEEETTIENANFEISMYTKWIEEENETIKHLVDLIERHTYYIDFCNLSAAEIKEEKEDIKYWTSAIKERKKNIRRYKADITKRKDLIKGIKNN